MLLLTGGMIACAGAQKPAKAPTPLPSPQLDLASLVGQPIPILPTSYIVSDSALPGLPVGRAAQLAWADSVLGEAFLARGPEATWLLPAELRRVARRAPGLVTDPDHMSQALLRYGNVRVVPDPLLANLRGLVALTGSRAVMVPAALHFSKVPEGVQVDATLVLADPRTGQLLWRSWPVSVAATAGEALAATIAHVLPDRR
jgi:hypothetical protein